MKGIQMGLNIVIVIVLAVATIAAIGVFFISNSFQTASSVSNQQAFSQGCVRYCKGGTYETYAAMYSALKSDSEFVQACTNLKYIDQGSLLLQNCLQQCPNCDVDVTQDDVNEGFNRLVGITTQG